MHLSCPTCGVLDGAITDADTGDPLVADINVTGPNGFDVTVTGSSYQLAVDDGSYDFTVSANGYLSQTATATAATGTTVTTDFALRPAEANISVDPQAFDVTLALGETAAFPLDIINDGAVATDFELREQPVVGLSPLADLIQDGSFEANPARAPGPKLIQLVAHPGLVTGPLFQASQLTMDYKLSGLVVSAVVLTPTAQSKQLPSLPGMENYHSGTMLNVPMPTTPPITVRRMFKLTARMFGL